MNVIGGEEPGRFAIHVVNPFSRWVRHGPEVSSRSESNLGEAPIDQAVFPDVGQSVYGPADEHGFSRFGPHDFSILRVPGHLAQINRLMAGQIYLVETDDRKINFTWKTRGEQVVTIGKYQERGEELVRALRCIY